MKASDASKKIKTPEVTNDDYYKRRGQETGFLKTMLALKLREIEHQYESYKAFVEATKLSNTIVFHLMRGTTSPSAKTIESLATNLGVHVHDLLGAPRLDKRGKLIPSSVLNLAKIEKALKKGADIDLEKFSGSGSELMKPRRRVARKFTVRTKKPKSD
jgi:transcriptional regulator with XRE-family HTH domain